MSKQHILQLQAAIAPYRAALVEHPLYSQLQTISQIQLFTTYHVFAVWDFMSLLKSLQQQLTCTTTPWVPIGSTNTRYLINEIVLGEESDVDEHGNRTSHFELYIKAMQQLGADTTTIEQLLTYINNCVNVMTALDQLQMPEAIKAFVGFTFDIVQNHPAHVQAAVFTFGREDLIPAMFLGLVNDLSASHPEQVSTLKYYLERHIEVDGDHHSHLAMEMVAELCGADASKWQAATEASIVALQKRQSLWNAISQKLEAAASLA
jgi:hypothetical protein